MMDTIKFMLLCEFYFIVWAYSNQEIQYTVILYPVNIYYVELFEEQNNT
jgi:hypothetical protein